jgi:hypothetical protein
MLLTMLTDLQPEAGRAEATVAGQIGQITLRRATRSTRRTLERA